LQDAATWFTNSAAKQFLAVPADHFLGGHAEQMLRGAVEAYHVEARVVKEQGVGKMIEDGFQNFRTLPLGLEMRNEVLRRPDSSFTHKIHVHS
jgi:hypothetical protein